MAVYNIDKLIQLLQNQQKSGLYYTSIQDIKAMLMEVSHDPPEVIDATKAIKSLDFHVSHGVEFIMPLDPQAYTIMLQISDSTSLRWRKSGVISSVYTATLRDQLKKIDKKTRLKRTLKKAYTRGEKVFSEKTMFQDVNARTCKHLIGLSTNEYKELKTKGVIKGKTLKDVLRDVYRYLNE